MRGCWVTPAIYLGFTANIGAEELVDQVFDSGLEDMDVLVRLDADHVFSHP
jgi:hypothetical protein